MSARPVQFRTGGGDGLLLTSHHHGQRVQFSVPSLRVLVSLPHSGHFHVHAGQSICSQWQEVMAARTPALPTLRPR
jgi:hypothetical protein